MVRGIVKECNDMIADDVEAKQALVQKLSYHSWFKDNKQQVRYSTDLNKIGISNKNNPGSAGRGSSSAASQARPTEESLPYIPRLYVSFDAETTTQSKIDACFEHIDDLFKTHDPASTGQSMIWMVRGLVKECNEALDDDALAKQGLAEKLAALSWFIENEQQVRYSA